MTQDSRHAPQDTDRDLQIGSCAPSPEELAAFCLLRLNREAEAERMLRPASDAQPSGYSQYYLGIALARRGEIGEAITCLGRACNDPHAGKAAREALVSLLRREVEQRMAGNDLEGAARMLADAMRLAPDDPGLQRHLSKLGGFVPGVFIRSNRRQEAASVWEEAQKRNPSDPHPTHSLALLYFWSAQDLEKSGNTEEAKKAWEGAVRNWVLLCHTDAFWDELIAERTQVYGSIPDHQVAIIRREATAALAGKITGFRSAYIDQGRHGDAKNMRLLSLKLALERKTAEALTQLVEPLTSRAKKTPMPPTCGPLMLEHLGELGSAQKVLAIAENRLPDEEATKHLHWCLSPWALPWIMLEERYYEDAIEFLNEEMKRHSSSKDGNNLLSRAYLEHGRHLSMTNSFEEALRVWLAGLDHARDAGVKEAIKEEAEKAAVQHAMKLQQEGGRENLNKAIELLERVRAVSDSPRIRTNLAELRASTMIAEIEALDDQGETMRAIERAREAHRTAPDRGDVRRVLSRLLNNHGVDAYNREDYDEAIPLLREAHDVDPSNPQARRNLSRALSNYGVHLCNIDRIHEGREKLEEALRVDPNNDHAKKMLNEWLRRFFGH